MQSFCKWGVASPPGPGPCTDRYELLQNRIRNQIEIVPFSGSLGVFKFRSRSQLGRPSKVRP